MTCRELAAIEHPERINECFSGGVRGCPCSNPYGYIKHRSVDDFCYEDNHLCTKCWDQEVDDEVLVEKAKQIIYKDCGLPPEIIDHLETDEGIKKAAEAYLTQMRSCLKDSGDRTEFESGAVRDMRTGKGRCDLMPLDVVGKMYIDIFKDESGIVFQDICEFQKTGDVTYLFDALHYFCVESDFKNHNEMFLEVAKHFEDGARKYGENNWQKGIPTNIYIDSAVRHLIKYIREDEDERHDRAFCWNIMCCIWTCWNRPELNVYRRDEKTDER